MGFLSIKFTVVVRTATSIFQVGLVSQRITVALQAELMLPDSKFMYFLKEYEKIYGKLLITPNMHLHAHLRDWKIMVVSMASGF